ncbi:MAG: hypothetical protein AAGG57_17840 [Pseudomonadota bacterium]
MKDIVTQDSALALVESIELPDHDTFHTSESDALPQPDLTQDSGQNIAVGSQIAGFGAGFDPALRPAIANAFLIAQLAADGAIANSGGGSEAWYSAYLGILTGLGMMAEDSTVSMREVSATSLYLHNEIIPVLTTLLGPAAATSTVLTVLSGLEQMDQDSPWITLFDRSSQRASANQFQISQAEMIDGVPRITLAAFALSAERSVTQVLFFRYSTSQATLKQFSKSLGLNTHVLSTAAPRIAEKLADRTLDFIADIQI